MLLHRSGLLKLHSIFHLCILLLIFIASGTAKAQSEYQAVAVAGGINWQHARDSAIILGGDLVTITSQSEQDEIESLISNGKWWIGANDKQSEGTWVWVSGETWDYTYWYPGEPNDAGNEDAAFIYVNLGYHWVDGDENSTNMSGFIMETTPVGPYPKNLRLRDSLSSSLISTLTPTIEWEYTGSALPQAMYEIQIGTDVDWTTAEVWATGEVPSSETAILYTGPVLTELQKYYIRVRVSDGTTWGQWRMRTFFVLLSSESSEYQFIAAHGISWNKAYDSAFALGGHLATIATPQEQTAITGLSGTLSGAWWIGATDEVSEGNWQWITGEPWTYTNWFGSEPNGGDDENVAALYVDLNNQWADYSENRENISGFILEINIHGPYPNNLRLTDSLNSYLVTSAQPTISWDYSGSASPQSQYEIQIGTNANWDVAEVWASGPVMSAATSVQYTGAPLTNHQHYYVRVRLNDGTEWGAWAVRGFTYINLNATYYEVIHAPGITWQEASDSAQALGGHLVTITTEPEQDYIATNVLTSGTWWIGATDAASEGNWQWVTDELWDYTNWLGGEPNGGHSENSAVISTNFGNKWIDYDGNRRDFSGFIFEIGDMGNSPFAKGLSVTNLIAGTYTVAEHPRFVWQYIGSDAPQAQDEIEIGVDNDWTSAEIWSSGPVLSTDTFIVYAGPALIDHQTYYYRVRLSDGTNVGPWVSRSFVYIDASTGPVYFSVFSNGLDWYEARDSAAALGGHLATITSAAEQSAVASNIQSGEFWIGATDEGSEGNWKWVTNEPWGYTNWYLNEPNGGFNENFATLHTSFANKWIDRPLLEVISGMILEIETTLPHPYSLRFQENYSEPYVGSTTPTIMWNYFSFNGSPQEQYEIEVGADTNWTIAEYWQSGPVASSGNQAVYSGVPLSDGSWYYLRMRVNDGSTWGNWVSLTFNVFDISQHVYQLVQTEFTWQHAADSARLAGGYLATITNPLEKTFVQSLLPSPAAYYIGGTDEVAEGTWRWITEEPFTYTNWEPGQPDNGSFQDYLEVSATSGKWNDASGTTPHWFVIEKDAVPHAGAIFFDGVVSNKHVIPNVPIISWARTSPFLMQDSAELEIGTTANWGNADIWNPPPFHSSDSMTLFAGSPLQDGATYYCRVRIASGGMWTSWSYTSFRMNTKPTPPLMNSALASYTELLPIIDVNAGNDAENDSLKYFFAAYSDSALTTLILTDSSGGYSPASSSTQWTVSTPFHDNSVVWWRCRVFDGYEFSDWSNKGKFIVNTAYQAPAVPTLVSPSDQPGMSVYDLTPLMQWFSFDPDPYDTIYYKLEIAPDSNFVFLKTFDSITTDSFELPDALQYNTRYWWQVTSYDQSGLSLGPSFTKSFWTWTLGDINASHSITIQDLVVLVNFLFGSATISPLKIGDMNGNCSVTIVDLVYLINFLFVSGPAPKVGCGP